MTGEALLAYLGIVAVITITPGPLLNPKAGAFFTAVLPQFVTAHGSAGLRS